MKSYPAHRIILMKVIKSCECKESADISNLTFRIKYVFTLYYYLKWRLKHSLNLEHLSSKIWTNREDEKLLLGHSFSVTASKNRFLHKDPRNEQLLLLLHLQSNYFLLLLHLLFVKNTPLLTSFLTAVDTAET